MEKLDIQPLDIQPLSENKLDIQPLDIQPLEDEGKKKKKTLMEDVSEGMSGAFGQLGNLADTGLTLAASNLARVFEGPEAQEKMFADMQHRINQRNKRFAPGADQSFRSKAIGMVGTLPAQMALMPLGPVDTGKTFIDNDETAGRTAAAMGVDTALTGLGMLAPGALGASRLAKTLSGAAINAGQETATRAILSNIAEQEETKKAFDPTVEAALLAAIPGAGFGAMARPKTTIDTTPEARMKAAAEARKAEAAVPTEQKIPGQLELFDTDTQGRGKNVNIPLDAQMRVDENGMPIRQDLSEELARTERAVEAQKQPDLFGNEDLMPIGNDKRGRVPVEGRNDAPLIADSTGDVYRPDQQQIIDFRNMYEKRLVDALDRQYYAENPDELAALRRQDTAAVQRDAQRRAEQAAVVRRRQEDEMWKQRQPAIDEAIAKRSQEAEAARFAEEDFQKLQEQLSKERVSKGQQRKMNRGMARGQRGALWFGDGAEKRAAVENLLKTKLTTEAPKGEDVVAAALQEGKDGRGWNSTESGGTLAALKRRSAAVLGASRILQRAQNDADFSIRQSVMPVEKSLRRLQKPEMVQLMNLFKEETSLQRKFSVAELAEFGYNPKILAAYNDLRTMFTKALEAENAGREARGQKPVTELEYYSSHRWQGDFRQDFVDANGKHVWSLAGKTKKDLARQREALLKEFPDLVADKERVVKQGKDVASPSELYQHMLDVLGKDDPAVQRVKEWYEQRGVEDPGAGMFSQEKHFKRRGGVRGYIGDRPGVEPTREALDFFQEQITYAKNGFKWAEMQKAGQEIKKIVSDENLIAQQPNNVNYIKDYWKQNLGVNEAKWIGALEDNLHDIGISPSAVRSVVGDVKSAWVGQKLLASAGFVLSNFVQASAVLPHMADLAVKTGGNPLAGIVGGMIGVMHIGAPHLVDTFFPSKNVRTAKRVSMEMMPEFYNKAMKYAEDNGVTSRSTYDESPVSASFSGPRKVAELAGKVTMVAPETLLRSFSFMAFAQQLKSSGKYSNDLDIFRIAEERTNAALVDYRAGERPMLFAKGGMLGDIAGTLQTFPMNFYNQWNWAGRELARGNVAPALTMLSVQYALAGFMGLPGFQDMDKLAEQVKTWAAKNNPKMWNTIKDWNPKRLVMDHLGESSWYGNLSTGTGVAMTSRVSAPSLTDMASSGGNMIADIGKQVGNVASLAVNPSEEQLAKTLIESAPVGLQGALETKVLRDVVSTPTEDGQLYKKRDSYEGDFVRTPEDEDIRALGMRSQREALVKDETYQAQKRAQEAKQVSSDLVERFYKAVRKGDDEDAASYARLYTELTGKGITSQQITERVIKEYTSKNERAVTAAKQLEAIKAIKRMQEIVSNSESSK